MVRLFAAFLIFITISAAAATVLDRKTSATNICATAEQEAKANNIDPSFLARLLWRESLFDPNVVSDKGAQGIAQFMPDTARRRGLDDPFEPISAVKASAAYLSELRTQFGNLGLAAAAYNAGEKRVDDWQKGREALPLETQDYVKFITGRDAGDWKNTGASFAIPTIGGSVSFLGTCVDLAMRKTDLSGPATLSAPRQPWGAVVAANFSEHIAVSMFQRLKLRFPKLLANRDPLIIRKRNLSRGTRKMAFVMLGEKSAAAAQATCANLVAVGAPCMVRNN
jgi:hypothetical protein